MKHISAGNLKVDQLFYDFINNEVSDFESVLDIGCGRGKKIIDFNYMVNHETI